MKPEIVGVYSLIAAHVGCFARIILDDGKPSCPEDARLAVVVLCGALWPLTVAAALALVLWAATCAFATSFAALWRAVRPPRPSVPRATARRSAP